MAMIKSWQVLNRALKKVGIKKDNQRIYLTKEEILHLAAWIEERGGDGCAEKSVCSVGSKIHKGRRQTGNRNLPVVS